MSNNKMKLGQFISQVRGIAYSSNQVKDAPEEGFVPVLRAGNFNENGINYKNLVYVPKSIVKDVQYLKKNDILIAASSGSLKVVGKNVQILEDWTGSFGAFCKVVRPNYNIDASYIKHFFQTSYYRTTIRHIINGANINNIKNGHIDNLKIPLPPLKTQKRIARILDQADALRRKNAELLDYYDKLVESVFLEMFGDPAFNPNKWEERLLISLCVSKNDIKCGPFGTQLSKSEYTEEGVPIWGIPQVNSRFKKQPTEYITVEKSNYLAQYSVESDDIVMSRKGNVGKCAIYPKGWQSGILHSDVLRIRCDKKVINPMFLVSQFRFSRSLQTQITNVSSGAIMAGVNVTKLKSIKPQIPPIALQNEFVKIVENIEAQKSKLKASIKESENLFQCLLQKAFKGEL